MKTPVKRHALVAMLAFAAVGLIVASAQVSETASKKVSATPSEKSPAKPAAEAAAALSAKPTAGDDVATARYAWYLFIQAMTPGPGPGGPLTFENWTEQCELGTLFCPTPIPLTSPSPSAPSKTRKFHESPLRAANLRIANLKSANATASATPGGIPNCSGMNTTGFPNSQAPNASPFPPPSNVAPSPAAQFCEEVYVNKAETTFVTTNGLTTLPGQQAYGKKHGGAITLPWDAVEIKVDWVPVSSFKSPSFQCPDPTHQLYTETIDGVCYAMVGLHISSKVLPNWLWATFEPNSSITNPNRCDPKLYDKCFDPWGTTSSKPYGKGPTPLRSAQLQQAMTAAGLDEAFNNYYLTGVQTEFVRNGKPVQLGSSFVEFNANIAPGMASCITCHRYAYFDGKQPTGNLPLEDNFGGPPYPSPLTKWAAVGYACDQPNPPDNCTPIVPNSTSQDFSWMLGLMTYPTATPTPTPTKSD